MTIFNIFYHFVAHGYNYREKIWRIFIKKGTIPLEKPRFCLLIFTRETLRKERHGDYHLEKMSRGRSFIMRKEEAKTDIRLAKRCIPAVIATGAAVR